MNKLKLTQAPVAKTGMLIRRPIAEVFAAFIDPEITTKFWFTKSSGRLDACQQVKWEWEMYDASTQVIVKAKEPMRQRLTPSASLSILAGFLAFPASATLESGVYQTLPGATVEERGERVPNGSRVVPFSATVTFDLSAAPPSLTAVIPDAVLEGGNPFALTVHGSSGDQLMDGTYKFTGDYLRDIYPSGTQYLFDWKFSTPTNGGVVWNGITFWAGGHIWYVTISNLTLVPQAQLSITRVGAASAQIAWRTNFTDYILEYSSTLPAGGWTNVTNAVSSSGHRHYVTVETDAAQRFYRLRKP